MNVMILLCFRAVFDRFTTKLQLLPVTFRPFRTLLSIIILYLFILDSAGIIMLHLAR